MKTRLFVWAIFVWAIFAIAIFSLTFSLSLPLAALESAQAAASAVDQSTRDEVVRFMELMQVRSQMMTIMNASEGQQKRIAEQSFKQTHPNATPQQLQRTDQMIDTTMKEMTSGGMIDEMIDAIVPIYQRHFSKADLDAILAFYTSPVGQKMQNENPAIAQESMQAVGDIVSKRLPELTQKMKVQMDKMAAEDKKANSN
jgi:hypothetical protein